MKHIKEPRKRQGTPNKTKEHHGKTNDNFENVWTILENIVNLLETFGKHYMCFELFGPF